METKLKSDLAAVAAVFAKSRNMKLGTVSYYATGTTTLLGSLDARRLSANTYDQAMQWFADNWVAGVPWPAGVRRPARLTKGRITWQNEQPKKRTVAARIPSRLRR
jgi:hypothetical protein